MKNNEEQLEKIISELKLKDYIDVTIERPIGFRQKNVPNPYPFNYGYIGIINPADNEDFDTIVLNFSKLKIGQKVKGKIVGILLRDDLDCKLITVKDGTEILVKDLFLIYDFYSPWHSGVRIEIW